MSAAEPTDLSYFGEIVRGLFPFLSRFGLTPGPAGKLSIRAAAEGIVIDALETIAIGASAKAVQLAGGTLPVARKTDSTGYLYAATLGGAVVLIYWSPTAPPDADWRVIASGGAVPTALTAGTPMSISSGSTKVSAG